MWIFPGGKISLVAVSFLITAVIFLIVRKTKFRDSTIKIALINFVALYMVIVVSVLLYDVYIEYKLSTFDLDADGIFGGVENTTEQATYMNIATNDAGRNFAPITGAVYAGVYSLVFYVILKIMALAKRNK